MRKSPFYITLFMFSLIGILALVCALFPADGIRIGDITLRFPTLSEMLQPQEVEEAPSISPEEILAQREAELRLQEENEILTFFRTNPAAIRFPLIPHDSLRTTHNSIGDSTYFDMFFQALQGADTTRVNIVHYGDSQIEEDRITNILRRRLQEDFTGGGVGLIPAYQSVQTLTIGQAMEYEPERSIVYHPAYKRNDKQYGPTGQMAYIDSTYTISIFPRDKKTGKHAAHYFSRLTLLSSNESGLTATVRRKKKAIANTGKSLNLTTFTLPDSTTKASIRLTGSGNLYGIILDNPTGVNIDNIPMRGCNGTIFTQIRKEQLSTYFQHTNTRLIILQFGGNRMPHIKDSTDINEYMLTLRQQIAYLKRQAPEAVFLFIGPSDMTTRRKGNLITYPFLPALNEQLMMMARESGIAYWSMFDAMGGRGSMQQWVKSGLAGKDYIHFTRRGAEEMGKMLYEELMTVYKYYKWRHSANDTILPEPLPKDYRRITEDINKANE